MYIYTHVLFTLTVLPGYYRTLVLDNIKLHGLISMQQFTRKNAPKYKMQNKYILQNTCIASKYNIYVAPPKCVKCTYVLCIHSVLKSAIHEEMVI